MAAGGGSSCLVQLIHWIDSYGEAIEVDLHREYRLDLLDFFRQRYSWRKLHLLIRHLPRASAFTEAQLNDPEVAEAILAKPDGPPARPAVAEYTTEVAALYDVCDRLAEVVAAVLVVGNRKPPQLQPRLRPQTEVERARLRREQLAHLDRVDEVKQAMARWAAAHGQDGDTDAGS